MIACGHVVEIEPVVAGAAEHHRRSAPAQEDRIVAALQIEGRIAAVAGGDPIAVLRSDQVIVVVEDVEDHLAGEAVGRDAGLRSVDRLRADRGGHEQERTGGHLVEQVGVDHELPVAVERDALDAGDVGEVAAEVDPVGEPEGVDLIGEHRAGTAVDAVGRRPLAAFEDEGVRDVVGADQHIRPARALIGGHVDLPDSMRCPDTTSAAPLCGFARPI